jgi:hypothetical protein
MFAVLFYGKGTNFEGINLGKGIFVFYKPTKTLLVLIA